MSREMTKDEMKKSMKQWSSSLGLEMEIDLEGGYTWISILGGAASESEAESIAQGLADLTGRSFYVSCWVPGFMEGVVDADFVESGRGEVPPRYEERKRSVIEDLDEFSPAPMKENA